MDPEGSGQIELLVAIDSNLEPERGWRLLLNDVEVARDEEPASYAEFTLIYGGGNTTIRAEGIGKDGNVVQSCETFHKCAKTYDVCSAAQAKKRDCNVWDHTFGRAISPSFILSALDYYNLGVWQICQNDARTAVESFLLAYDLDNSILPESRGFGNPLSCAIKLAGVQLPQIVHSPRYAHLMHEPETTACNAAMDQNTCQSALRLAGPALLKRDGIYVLRKFLTEDDIKIMRQTVESFEFDRSMDGNGGRFHRGIAHTEHMVPLFRIILKNKPLLEHLHTLLPSPERTLLHFTETMWNTTFGTWHRDIQLRTELGGARHSRGVSAWGSVGKDLFHEVKVLIYLQDHSVGDCLLIKNGSHKFGSGGVWFDKEPEWPSEKTHVKTQIGDIIIFDPRLVHSGAVDGPTAEPRGNIQLVFGNRNNVLDQWINRYYALRQIGELERPELYEGVDLGAEFLKKRPKEIADLLREAGFVESIVPKGLGKEYEREL